MEEFILNFHAPSALFGMIFGVSSYLFGEFLSWLIFRNRRT